MKKLKFRNFLFKKLIWAVIIGIIISLAFTGIAYSVYLGYTDMFSIYISAEAENMIRRGTTDAGRRWSMGMYFDSAINEIMGVDAAAVIYDEETNEILMDSEFNIYTVIPKSKSETGKAIYLVNKSEEFRNVIENYTKMRLPVRIDCEQIYVDGESFYPGRVTVSLTDDPVMNIDGGEAEEFDFTPENASDYRMVDYHTMTFAAGSYSDSMALQLIRENFTDDEIEFEGDLTNVWRRSIDIDGKDYSFAVFYILDFWGSFAIAVVETFAVVLFIAVAIAFLTAYRRYRKYCTQYSIDEHRRNMTNALAHDLKSPLTAIHGYAENLKENIHSEKREYYADAVLENVRYMNEIITNTLDLAKLETSEKGIKKEKIDITALTEKLFEKYSLNIKNRNITVEISGNLTVSADKAMMSRAVENLISNAVKFTDDGGKITVSATEKSLVISNTFTGNVDKENIEAAFGKSDESRSNRKGSGLGLSIVKNIAALHKFRFETEAKDGIFTAKISF